MRVFGAILLLFVAQNIHAQSSNAPLNRDYYHLLDRYEILSGKNNSSFNRTYKAFTRSSIAQFVDTIRSSQNSYSAADYFNLNYLGNDNWEFADTADYKREKPILKYFYHTKPDLLNYQNKDVDFHLSPVLHLGYGLETESSVNPWINTRGVELRGMIDGKVGFYSFLGENQMVTPAFVRSYVSNRGVVPHEGFFKTYNTNGYDFFTARGYISWQFSKHINGQFGHDRFFIGNGYRSFILSDNVPAYLFLKFNTKVGRVQYTNLFTQMTADVNGRLGGGVSGSNYPNKYVVLHHLNFNIGKKLNIGVFESIAYGREDSTGNNQFDLNYLNPVIFYRAIEQQNGSTDNVLLGTDFSWIISRNYQLYGQLVLDEFKLDEVTAGNGWWANKWAYQIGGKYINVAGVSNLDLLLEYNYSRPYVFAHTTIYTNLSHRLQELGHPLGANLREIITEIRYQPLPRFNFVLRAFMANQGRDDDVNTNWGSNIFKDYTTREQEYGNETGQGVETDWIMVDFTSTYTIAHNMFVDLKFLYRDLKSDTSTLNSDTRFFSFAFRWNIPQRLHEF